jgi:hypothetical protein
MKIMCNEMKFVVIGFVFCLLHTACNHTHAPHSKKVLAKANNQKDKNPGFDTTHSSKNNLDTGKLERFFYPQMSFCGGALEGIYLNDVLIRIESTYGYDMGYSEQNIDFKDGRITKIEYRQHYANWEKYNERYGAEGGDIDPSKMTYFDTLYILKFKPKREFTIYSGKKKVNGEVSKELLKSLLDCTVTMQNELNTERSKI